MFRWPIGRVVVHVVPDWGLFFIRFLHPLVDGQKMTFADAIYKAVVINPIGGVKDPLQTKDVLLSLAKRIAPR